MTNAPDRGEAARRPDENTRSKRLPLAGTFNTRDVACRLTNGRQLRPGMVWRSDEMHRLDGNDRRLLAATGIRTVIDLRDSAERAERPNALEGLDLDVCEFPLLEDLENWEESPGSFLLAAIRDRGVVIAAIARRLARPRALPAVLVCGAGKDRTGVVLMTLLSALGVSDDDVADDFTQTVEMLGSAYYEQFEDNADSFDDFTPDWADARSEWVHDALELLAVEYGGAANYLVRHGLDESELQTLRAVMTAPSEVIGPIGPSPATPA